MGFTSFGYKVSSEGNSFIETLRPVPENAVSRVLFAGWTGFVYEDRQGQLRICGGANEGKTELIRLCSLESNGNTGRNVSESQSTPETSVRVRKQGYRHQSVKFYGWSALQGYLSSEGHVVALCLNDSNNDSLYTPRQVYATALDVASCGPSTDYCTVVVGRLTGALYYWTLSDPVSKPLLPESSSLPGNTNTQGHPRKIKFTRVWAGEAHFLALDEEGTLYSWGSGRHGQLGNGDLVLRAVPEPIEALEGIRIVDAACGASFSVALSESGDVYTFGLNDHGQLGIGKAMASKESQRQPGRCNTALPQVVDFFEDGQGMNSPIELSVVKVACGHSHTVVLDESGQVWSCGWGKYGQLGPKPDQKESVEDRQRMLRSKGYVTIEEDQYLFQQVPEFDGGRRRWSDVCCGRWSTFIWTEGDEDEDEENEKKEESGTN